MLPILTSQVEGALKSTGSIKTDTVQLAVLQPLELHVPTISSLNQYQETRLCRLILFRYLNVRSVSMLFGLIMFIFGIFVLQNKAGVSMHLAIWMKSPDTH